MFFQLNTGRALLQKIAGGLLLGLASLASAAPIEVTDDTGAKVVLPKPPQRIVVLAPHLTENLFAIGAGDLIVGAVDYSDYPEAAKKLPRVGGYSRLDVEGVLGRKPDLVVGWQSGNNKVHLDRIRALGVPLYLSQPNEFDEVAGELRRLGRLTGRDASAEKAASAFTQRLDSLRKQYSQRPKVRVFYQVWQSPLMTIGNKQIISSIIATCGGENVFNDLAAMAPQISEEAVLAKNAEAFVAGGMGEVRKDWLEAWRKWKQLTAVQRNNLFFVPADLMQRHTPRLLDGAEMLCQHLETARQRRPVGEKR